MEITSHSSLENLLPAGHSTVGYEVHVRHVAPAAPGSTILVTTKLTEVKGNKLYFDVACHQGETLFGSGTHKRAIVPAHFYPPPRFAFPSFRPLPPIRQATL